MNVLAFLLASSAASMSVALPDSVLFSEAPATMEQMRAIEGTWATSRNVPAVTFSAVRPGWISLKVERGVPRWGGTTGPFPVAVTRNNGQLFINTAVRFAFPMPEFKNTYQGKECYGTIEIRHIDGRINLLSLDDVKMRAVNNWYPREMSAWEGEQAPCGDLVVRAEAARHQRVVVMLDPKSWFGGPLHRIPARGLDKTRGRH